MARIDDIKAELELVRAEIQKAEVATSLSVAGRSLSRQSLDGLQQREAQLSWWIQEYYANGPFGTLDIKTKGRARRGYY